MQMVGGGAEDCVDGIFLFQHHTEVFILSAAEIGCLFREVLLYLLAHVPSTRSTPEVKCTQIPLRCRVGYCNDLGSALAQQFPDVRPALSAGTHYRNIYLVTGRQHPVSP